ncbi:helix-turn-helix transcriptional regulator [Aureimonas psammosilenae]|uniref:helix-turn-helix transcriptional regulator n=1 Tax=Aureimonas psammosilenae TaxID=2495496 RepID=UPI001260D0A8|nr:helix-turn-helix transcriptional regulator [Aureimonas psammosilenae]
MASIDDVIDGFYEASERPDILPNAVGAAHRHFRSQSGGLYVQSLRQNAGPMSGAEAAIALGYDRNWLQLYFERYYASNPMFELTKRLGTGRVVTEADTLRFPQARPYLDSEFYVDWARPQGLRHVMGEFLERQNDGVLIMAVWRTAAEGGYLPEEAADFGRLNRHISRALDVGARLRAAEAEMETLIGRMPSAVFTIGRDGRLRQTNAAADALLTAGIALRNEGGRLRTVTPEDQPGLDRLLACAFESKFAAWAEGARLPLRRSDGKPPLVARAIVVAGRFDPFGLDRSASMILTVDGYPDEEPLTEARLQRRFGLSPAQVRVAMQMRDGKTPTEAAAALGLSVETVRTHLKALFARTGTKRQMELALLLQREGR